MYSLNAYLSNGINIIELNKLFAYLYQLSEVFHKNQ